MLAQMLEHDGSVWCVCWWYNPGVFGSIPKVVISNCNTCEQSIYIMLNIMNKCKVKKKYELKSFELTLT